MLKKLLTNPTVRKIFIYLFTDGINKAIPFLLLPILTVYLTPTDYGLVTNFKVLLGISMVFISLSVHGAISSNYYKFSETERAEYIGNAISIVFLTYIITSVTILLFSGLIFELIKIPLSYQILAVNLAFTQTITIINITLWRLEENPFKFGLYNILQTAVNFGASLYFIIILNQGWTGRVDGILVSGIIFGVTSLFLLYRRKYIKLKIKKEYYRDILLFGLPMIPHALSLWTRTGIDKVLITNLVGEHENGLYSVGFQFGLLLSFITIAGNNALAPILYKNLSLKKGVELENFKKRLVRLNAIGIATLAILGILFAILSYFLIEYFLDESYKESQSFVFWAIFTQVFQGFYLLFVNYIFFVKKTKNLSLISIVCSILHLFVSYFMIKQFGAIGGAYSVTFISFINFICVAIYSQKVFPLPWNFLASKLK